MEFIESRCSLPAVEDYLGDLHTEDYLFIRIGEDINDIEVCGDYVDNPLGMSMDRTISFS